VVHVGAPDEAGHRRDAGAKAQALEALDAALLAPLSDTVARAGGTLAVCPDHGTDPLDGTHDAGAVPALRWGRGIAPAGPDRMTEAATTGAPVRPAAWPLHGAARLEAAA
jgi:2,3-bisphosphoglycerate-independent phosphoglycerate mutase